VRVGMGCGYYRRCLHPLELGQDGERGDIADALPADMLVGVDDTGYPSGFMRDGRAGL